MRFRFCGDLDAPDWLLKEISTLAKLTAVKIRMLGNEILKKLQTGDIDYENVYKNTQVKQDVNLEPSDIKGVVAALHFILSNSVKYNVNAEILTKELTQLGLPKEHSEALARVYVNKRDTLREEFRKRSLKLPRLESVEWRVDYLISSNVLQELQIPSVQLRLRTTSYENPSAPATTTHSFEISADKFRVLLNELKIAKNLMDSFQES